MRNYEWYNWFFLLSWQDSRAGFAQGGQRAVGPRGPQGPGAAAAQDAQLDVQDAMQHAMTDSTTLVEAAKGNSASGVSLSVLVTDGKLSTRKLWADTRHSTTLEAREMAAAANDLVSAAETLAMSSIGFSNAAGINAPPSQPGVTEEAFRANDEIAWARSTNL